MTTIAYDGKILAADTLATDHWGLKNDVMKLFSGDGFMLGGAGSLAPILKWWQTAQTAPDILTYGYPDFNKDDNDPTILLVIPGKIFTHSEGTFIEQSRKYHAIGSGRDFALTAMRLGATAVEAINIAMEFDNNTGGDIITRTLP